MGIEGRALIDGGVSMQRERCCWRVLVLGGAAAATFPVGMQRPKVSRRVLMQTFSQRGLLGSVRSDHWK